MADALFIDVGWLGSVADLATFAVVIVEVARREMRDGRFAAALVALAKSARDIDAYQVARDLDVSVDDDSVRALRTDGGEEGRE